MNTFDIYPTFRIMCYSIEDNSIESMSLLVSEKDFKITIIIKYKNGELQVHEIYTACMDKEEWTYMVI